MTFIITGIDDIGQSHIYVRKALCRQGAIDILKSELETYDITLTIGAVEELDTLLKNKWRVDECIQQL